MPCLVPTALLARSLSSTTTQEHHCCRRRLLHASEQSGGSKLANDDGGAMRCHNLIHHHLSPTDLLGLLCSSSSAPFKLLKPYRVLLRLLCSAAAATASDLFPLPLSYHHYYTLPDLNERTNERPTIHSYTLLFSHRPGLCTITWFCAECVAAAAAQHQQPPPTENLYGQSLCTIQSCSTSSRISSTSCLRCWQQQK